MAYREFNMIQIKEILLRLAKGESKRSISRSLGVHLLTINKYLRLARSIGTDPVSEGIDASNDELIESITATNNKERAERFSRPAKTLLLPFKEKIEGYIKDGLKGSKILQLIQREGITIGKTTFYGFLAESCPSWVRNKITVRLPETEPGEYAQCDFGRLGKLWDENTNKYRIAYAFIITLCHSRHIYVYVTFRQDMQAVINGCEEAFEYFGGIPRILICDNPKPIISKPDRYTPAINTTFLEYAQYRNFIVDPTVVADPKGKPIVERTVAYVRGSFFSGERFINLADCKSRALDWCSNIAGKRIHQTTRMVPIEVFEKVEKPALQPYDGKRYDIPQWGICKVHPDHHIRFGNALYSVPTSYIGKQVEVRGDRVLVKIYYRGEVIKIHNTVPRGKRSTDFRDYPEKLTPYTLRNPLYQIKEGHRKHPVIDSYIESILEGPYPWHRLRSAQKILRMADKYGPERVAKACEKAKVYSLYDTRRIERMLKNNLETSDTNFQEEVTIPDTGKFQFERQQASFNHYKSQIKEE